MKKLKPILSALLLLSSIISYSQGIGINNDESDPDPSAILDVKSTTQGMLVPRMTTAQRIAISAPANSLLIYDTSTKVSGIMQIQPGRKSNPVQPPHLLKSQILMETPKLPLMKEMTISFGFIRGIALKSLELLVIALNPMVIIFLLDSNQVKILQLDLIIQHLVIIRFS